MQYAQFVNKTFTEASSHFRRTMIYKQGRTFPPTAQGAGLIFSVLALLFLALFPKLYLPYFGFYMSIWIFFSNSSIDTSEIHEGTIIRRFGLFPFKFFRRIRLANYDAGVIKVVRVKYSTTQSTGVFVIGSQETSDEFLALNLKLRNRYEMEVLFKGTRSEIESFIKDNLTGTDLRFFNGVLEKRYELDFKK